MLMLDNRLVLSNGPYLFYVTCKGRRGVVVGTHLKDVYDRAIKYFFFWQ